ncbi:hypothetical protein [Mycobacterium conspicuum]|jgi:hypothetical protein|uniref:Uncharacterized protein n=1 Tax=Mycobacterium conspicuum TaxID=44010 RepID=A0A1X1T3S5_9MYCO|nr:hypothetical protein [Mycobacterium conspicuum]ORV39138.1 hypothetical protein AWC00_18675 [Mycobacterium conspicuum]BBZ39372.1 hypothetical protein MCNS_24350 [Mycobacterium conspicuum]
MSITSFTAALGTAGAVLLIAPVIGASPAHADISGYRRCVAGNAQQLPLRAPDPLSMQLVGEIEQALKSGVSPDAEAQRVAQTGFDQHAANAVVQCVIQNYP